MKIVSNSKIILTTPRKIRGLLCQASAATEVLFNVCKASFAKFAVQKKCA